MTNYKDILQEHGVSVTSPRIEILTLLEKSKEPLTIEMLTEKLKGKVHPTTLYRSLKLLVDKGIVYQTDFRDGVAYFEYHGDNHHHHLVCTSCKKKVSIDICITDTFPKLEKKTSFSITNHILEIFGLCEDCS